MDNQTDHKFNPIHQNLEQVISGRHFPKWLQYFSTLYFPENKSICNTYLFKEMGYIPPRRG